jgi:recombination protein RecA
MGDGIDFEVVEAPNGGPPEEEVEVAPEPTTKKGKKKQTFIGTGGVPLALLMKEVEKQHGAGVIVRATHFKALVLPRIQTTIFPFDLALGGGIPRGRISLFSGGKASGKSTVSLKTVARFQAMTAHLDPPPQAAWVDAEGVFEPDWALANGVDLSRLVVVRPSYAEQATDVFCACLSAREIELLVLDSIAALVPMVEIEKSAVNKQQGEQAQLVGKFVRRMVGAMNDWAQRDQPRTIILINQLRQQIGGWAPHGITPEIEPGGMGQIFAASVTVRFKRIKYEFVEERIGRMESAQPPHSIGSL